MRITALSAAFALPCVALWPLDGWESLNRERNSLQRAVRDAKAIPLRSSDAVAESWARFKSGNGTLFFRHVRKAGGTSARQALQKIAVKLGNAPGFTHLEWAAFPASCLGASPTTFFATVLRDPLKRVHSEWVYSGVSHMRRTYRIRTLAVNETALMLQWLAEPNRGKVFSRDAHTTNAYTRAFSGRCPPGDAVPARIPSAAAWKKRHKDDASAYEAFWGGTACSWSGSAWGGGCSLSANVDEDDYELAVRVLELFNLRIALDWLSDPDYTKYLAGQFGVPFAFPKRNAHHSDRKPRSLPEPVASRLRALEHLDLRLYRGFFAAERRRFEAWRAPPGSS